MMRLFRRRNPESRPVMIPGPGALQAVAMAGRLAGEMEPRDAVFGVSLHVIPSGQMVAYSLVTGRDEIGRAVFCGDPDGVQRAIDSLSEIFTDATVQETPWVWSALERLVRVFLGPLPGRSLVAAYLLGYNTHRLSDVFLRVASLLAVLKDHKAEAGAGPEAHFQGVGVRLLVRALRVLDFRHLLRHSLIMARHVYTSPL